MLEQEFLFNLSKKNKGYIYVLDITDYCGYRWLKLGKTKDISKRLDSYKKQYKEVAVVSSYKVDHISLREDLLKRNFNFYEKHESEWTELSNAESLKTEARICSESKVLLKGSLIEFCHAEENDGEAWTSSPAIPTLRGLVRIKHN